MAVAQEDRARRRLDRDAAAIAGADLLEEARARKINLSQTLETALAAEIKKRREAEWLEQNKAAIEAYNREIAEHGLWSDGLRQF